MNLWRKFSNLIACYTLYVNTDPDHLLNLSFVSAELFVGSSFAALFLVFDVGCFADRGGERENWPRRTKGPIFLSRL